MLKTKRRLGGFNPDGDWFEEPITIKEGTKKEKMGINGFFLFIIVAMLFFIIIPLFLMFSLLGKKDNEKIKESMNHITIKKKAETNAKGYIDYVDAVGYSYYL